MKAVAAEKSGGRFRRLAYIALVGALLGIGSTALWIGWAETHPQTERELRLAWRAQLEAWFPVEMAPSPRDHGLFRRDAGDLSSPPLAVVLVHGLDEPGDIWDDLVPQLRAARTDKNTPLCAVWELRYPNDQAIDRSAAFLAERWPALPAETPVVLIGHSMGGLVIREFVSAWRHPVEAEPRVRGASVQMACLVGTPNHGSEWARLRCWLELRDHFPDDRDREFSLFASLRDGVGTAKIDLRPGSEFLDSLNARPWPEAVELRLIAGRVMRDDRFADGFASLMERMPDGRREVIQRWWDGLDGDFGDGVVTMESVTLPGVEPVVFAASHRGLLRQSAVEPGEPPALKPLLEWVREAISAPD